jgi:hypothetical protein
MNLTKYIQKYKTPTCFGTETPSSGNYLSKGIRGQHAYAGNIKTELTTIITVNNNNNHKLINYSTTNKMSLPNPSNHSHNSIHHLN